jgi:hypothetical protein
MPPKATSGRHTAHKATRVKFVIKYGPKYRPRNTAYVLGGYVHGPDIHVLYRVSGGFNTFDGHLHLNGDRAVHETRVPKEDRLPESRWDEFLSLPEHATFVHGKQWRKMSVNELRSLLGGRVLQITPLDPEVDGP